MRKITIKGKDYPCRITMGAMLRFKRETGHEASELSSGDISEMAVFLWCCVTAACNADGVDFGMDVETFADSLEVDEMSRIFGEAQADIVPEPKKKTKASKG